MNHTTSTQPLAVLRLQDGMQNNFSGELINTCTMHQNYHSPEKNDLLAALPKDELAELLPHLELLDMSTDEELYEFGRPLNHVYFPITAIISLLYVMEDGATTELAVIGHEGMLGITLIFGDSLLGTPVVQNAGFCYRLKLSKLKEIFNRGGELQSLLMRYTQARLAHMAQSAVCGHHYSIDQKLSRWILDRLDRLPSNILKTTQELIASMLGVRRESVTEAVGKLQDEGIIQCTRGKITVLDRLGLESLAGECYKVAKNEYDHLFLKDSRKMVPN